MDSSPGCCNLAMLGTINSDVFKYDPVTGCDPTRVEYVRATVLERIEALRNDSYADPLKVFIKKEPHKISKIQDGRLRLISAVSLVDALVDRILFGWLLRRALSTVGKTPCLLGWSPVRGGWRYIYQRFGDRPVACLDKSSWDWTVQKWLVQLWFKFVVGLAVNAPDWWLQLAAERFEHLFCTSNFFFADGTIVKQKHPGIMKSGCLLTLILNSVGQSLLHYVAALRLNMSPTRHQPISVGDDTTQISFEQLQEYVREIEKLGAKVKGFKVRNWVEFCGFAFAGGTCIPAYWEKHLFKICYGNIEDKITSYQAIYANEPVMFKYMNGIAASIDPGLVLSGVEARAIMNGDLRRKDFAAASAK